MTSAEHGDTPSKDSAKDSTRDVAEPTASGSPEVLPTLPAPAPSRGALARTREAGESEDVTLAASDQPQSKPSRGLEIPRGKSLGRYVVLERLGEGGMGVVYAAYDPELDRKVAVKLLQSMPGAASLATGGRARLLREAQAMARLTHPNVISVFDVGTIDDAVFVAMEFVPGRTLKTWLAEARQREAAWRELLEPILAAGRGLVAAHAAGIVHRDFKPDNVMIAAEGDGPSSLASRVRVLDFGLARPTGSSPRDTHDFDNELESGQSPEMQERSTTRSRLSSSSNFDLRLTATGAIMGTPAYMAPEQHLGRATDASTDQFAFCVVVYEALYGQRPFAGKTMAALAANVVRERLLPPPKGAKVPAHIHKAVVRGLSRNPDQRHPSMEDLLDELARDPARSRRRVLTGALLVVAGGSVAAIAAGLGPDHSLCEGVEQSLTGVWDPNVRDRVRAAFDDESKAYADAALPMVEQRLDSYAAQWVAMRTEACEASRVRGEQSDAVLTLRMACLDERRNRLAALTELLAEADYEMVKNAIDAAHDLPSIEACADIETLRLGVAPPDDPQMAQRVAELRAEVQRARVLASAGKLEEARTTAEAALRQLRGTAYDPAVAEALDMLGSIHLQAGRYDEAQGPLQESLYLADLTGHDKQIIETSIALMTFEAWAKHRWDVALAHGRRAEAVLQRVDAWPEQRARMLTHRAQVHGRRDDNEAAIDDLEAAMAILRELEVDRLPGALPTLNNLATRYVDVERYDDAQRTLDQALQIATEKLGALHPDVGVTHVAIARLMSARSDYEGALAHLRQALQVLKSSLGPDHGNVVAVLNGIGLTLHHLERLDEAREAFERAVAILDRGTDDPLKRAHVLNNLGSLEKDAGKSDAALTALHESIDIKSQALDPEHREVAFGLDNLGLALMKADRPGEALEAFRRAAQLLEKHYGPDSAYVAYSLTGAGEALLASRQPEAARTELVEAIRAYGASEGPDIDDVAHAHFTLAKAEAALENDAEATRLARHAIVLLLSRPGEFQEARAEIEQWLSQRSSAG